MSALNRSKEFRKRMAIKGFKSRPFWLSGQTIAALDEIQERQDEGVKTRDAIVNESILIMAAMTPDEYRMLLGRLDKD